MSSNRTQNGRIKQLDKTEQEPFCLVSQVHRQPIEDFEILALQASLDLYSVQSVMPIMSEY